MFNLRASSTLVVLLLAGWQPTSAAEPDSASLAMKGKAVWSAFSCSSLASAAGDSKQSERLFNVGYESGKAFINAARAGKIEKQDVDHIVPSGVLWVMQGPNADFILGRIFAAAQEEALKGIFATGDHLNSDEEKKLLASTRFAEANCALIGS